jgi:hypothetical protein
MPWWWRCEDEMGTIQLSDGHVIAQASERPKGRGRKGNGHPHKANDVLIKILESN